MGKGERSKKKEKGEKGEIATAALRPRNDGWMEIKRDDGGTAAIKRRRGIYHEGTKARIIHEGKPKSRRKFDKSNGSDTGKRERDGGGSVFFCAGEEEVGLAEASREHSGEIEQHADGDALGEQLRYFLFVKGE